MVMEISSLLLIGAIWLFAGYQILRFLIPHAGLIALLSLGGILGETLYLFFVNAIAYVLQVRNASLATLGGMLVLGLVCFYINRKRRIPVFVEINKTYLILIIAAAIFLVSLYAVNLFFA